VLRTYDVSEELSSLFSGDRFVDPRSADLRDAPSPAPTQDDLNGFEF
jgi:hypothetical protein